MILLSVVDTVARIMVGKKRPQSMILAPPTGVFSAHTSYSFVNFNCGRIRLPVLISPGTDVSGKREKNVH